MATKKKSTKAKTKKAPVKKPAKAIAVSKTKTSSKNKFSTLKKWNILLAVVLVGQAIAIVVLGKSVSLPVNTQYLTNDALASQAAGHTVLVPAVRHMFDVNVRYLVGAFLAVAAIIYGLAASVWRQKYEAQLAKRINIFRWINFTISGGLMFVLVAMLNGVYEAASLLMIVVLFGLLQFLGYFGEAKAGDRKAKNQTFIALCVAGLTVWLAIAMYLKGAIFYGVGLSHYVYWIDGGLFVIALCLAANKFQVFKASGRWADYIYGERIFMILSLIAKSGLAWLVFAGLLK